MSEAMREKARVWLIENNHHACHVGAFGTPDLPKEDDVKFLALMLDEVWAAAVSAEQMARRLDDEHSTSFGRGGRPYETPKP